jgi:RNA polymerase sigma-70 factor (ECF subfamily)
MQAIEQLPIKQRLVFEYRYFDELKYEEIATITGGSVGGLKANYFHALDKVEKYLVRQLNLS